MDVELQRVDNSTCLVRMYHVVGKALEHFGFLSFVLFKALSSKSFQGLMGNSDLPFVTC